MTRTRRKGVDLQSRLVEVVSLFGVVGGAGALLGLIMDVTRASFTEDTGNSGSSITAADCFSTTDIDVGNFYFSPDPVTIGVGCTVRWTVSQGSHTTTSTTGVWDSGMLGTGSSFSYTFTATGTYVCQCTPHSNKPAQSNRQIIVQ